MPAPPEIPVVLITGPTGVGKSQVVAELSRLLDNEGVEHARIDWDTLITGPVSRRRDLVLLALQSAWSVHRQAGAGRLLLAASLEQREMFYDIPTAIHSAGLRAFCLRASPDEIAQRLRYRERGGLSERIFLRDMPVDLRVYEELAHEFDDVDTSGRTATDVAGEILARSGWLESG